jgi:hypothetical protein
MNEVKIMKKDVLVRKILKGMEYKEDIRNGIWINTNDTYNDFFYHVHDGMLPDDFRYKMIHSILQEMDDNEEYEDLNIDDLIPIYTNELISWLDSSISRLSYCDQYLEEYVVISDTISLLSGGYMMELNEVYYLINEWLDENIEEE